MTRGYLTTYLTTQDCYPDERCDSDIAQLWHNGINGESCYVPYEDELAITTWAHIIYELRVDPPLEYDSDYHVYSSFREHHQAQIANKQ